MPEISTRWKQIKKGEHDVAVCSAVVMYITLYSTLIVAVEMDIGT